MGHVLYVDTKRDEAAVRQDSYVCYVFCHISMK